MTDTQVRFLFQYIVIILFCNQIMYAFVLFCTIYRKNEFVVDKIRVTNIMFYRVKYLYLYVGDVKTMLSYYHVKCLECDSRLSDAFEPERGYLHDYN